MKNPKLISKPFAQNGQKNVIPEKYETSMESNQATWDQGFGQITMLPVSAGGLPPKGQDFNGILNQICETIVHISKGGVFKFSADYAAAINGYPKGAILQSEDEKKYYQSLIDNNKVNFNTASQEQIKTSWKLVMTDDILDQLSKKLESSAVVQSTGTSTTSVMSQKASTDAFQPKGNYQPSGNYALKGDSYTKAEENNLLGGKLDKSGGDVGALTVTTNSHGRNIQLKRSDSKPDSPQPELISFHHGNDSRRGYVGFGGFDNVIRIANDEMGSSLLVSDTLKFNNERVLTESDLTIPHPIPWSLSNAPTGYLICQGQTFNKSTYPKLASAYPSGRLPDLRGEFIRGADAGRGVDTGREVLSSQAGSSLLSARGLAGNSEFSLKMSSGSVGTDNQGQREIYQQIEGQNGNETRPRNIAFLYIVRAA